MQYIMMAINESWFWLGPLLIICLGVMAIATAVEIYRDEMEE